MERGCVDPLTLMLCAFVGFVLLMAIGIAIDLKTAFITPPTKTVDCPEICTPHLPCVDCPEDHRLQLH